jgi:hypothetical protein
MKINIVIPFYKNLDTIENLLRSIDDQDYKKHTTTIIIDGKDLDAQDTLNGLLDTFTFKLLLLNENKGAPFARNYGAKDAKGDILFFIDADCKLYPGMLRECVTQLELNPDKAFVYGNYRFEDKFEFKSNPFDGELLKTMNFVSTMSPIRREVFEEIGGFNEELEFFQDWDLFYRAYAAGHKGKYINEFLFSTQTSQEDNISGSKGMTLAEKAKIFRSNHNLENRQLVVTTFGAPLQAAERAKYLDADYAGPMPDSLRAVMPTNLFFEDWKATYFVGCYNHPIEALQNHMAHVVGKPIYHFIGTDVHQLLTSHSWKNLKFIKEAFEINEAILYANSPRMVAELAEVGIPAKLLYTPLTNSDGYKKTKKLPKKLTVAVYYSDSPNLNYFNPEDVLDNRGGQSNVGLVFEAAKAMPDVKFKFFGGAHLGKVDNVEFMGKIPQEDMPAFVNSCSAIVRSTVHDGFPQLPIQFMLCGRNALVSVPDKEYGFAYKLSFEDVLDHEAAKNELIEKIYDLGDFGEPDPKEVRKYYDNLLSVKKFKKEIHSNLGEIK